MILMRTPKALYSDIDSWMMKTWRVKLCMTFIGPHPDVSPFTFVLLMYHQPGVREIIDKLLWPNSYDIHLLRLPRFASHGNIISWFQWRTCLSVNVKLFQANMVANRRPLNGTWYLSRSTHETLSTRIKQIWIVHCPCCWLIYIFPDI